MGAKIAYRAEQFALIVGLILIVPFVGGAVGIMKIARPHTPWWSILAAPFEGLAGGVDFSIDEYKMTILRLQRKYKVGLFSHLKLEE
jgi:hypothetical protein